MEEVTLLQEITEAVRGAVRAFVEDRTDKEGRVSVDSLNTFARNLGFQVQPWVQSLKVRHTKSAFLKYAMRVVTHRASLISRTVCFFLSFSHNLYANCNHWSRDHYCDQLPARSSPWQLTSFNVHDLDCSSHLKLMSYLAVNCLPESHYMPKKTFLKNLLEWYLAMAWLYKNFHFVSWHINTLTFCDTFKNRVNLEPCKDSMMRAKELLLEPMNCCSCTDFLANSIQVR